MGKPRCRYTDKQTPMTVFAMDIRKTQGFVVVVVVAAANRHTRKER